MAHSKGKPPKKPAKIAAPPKQDDSDKEGDDWYERKSSLMEGILGKQHDTVLHSLIPYFLGGSLDLYYYPNGIEGTAVATKELSEAPGTGSKNEFFKNYELVMFTRHKLDLGTSRKRKSPFEEANERFNAILNSIARFSAEASLNPDETCDYPDDMEFLGGRCLIFDTYCKSGTKPKKEFGLLAIIEIHRSEQLWSRMHGGDKLLVKLKEKGHWPYSDLDRKPVV